MALSEKRGTALRLLGGGLAVFAIVAGGRAAALLSAFDPPPLRTVTISDAAGNSLVLLSHPGAGGLPPRIVAARGGVRIERLGRLTLLVFEGGARRVLPSVGSWVLAETDGRFECLAAPVSDLFVWELERRPPSRSERLPDWLRRPNIRSYLGPAASRIEAFFSER